MPCSLNPQNKPQGASHSGYKVNSPMREVGDKYGILARVVSNILPIYNSCFSYFPV